MAEDDLKLGVANEIPLSDAYGVLSGGRGAEVQALLNSLVPEPEKVDAAQLAIRFFSQMGANAAQPGSTALSAAASALPSAANYLAEVNKRNKELERSRGTLAIQLASAIKPSTTGTTTLKSVIVTKPNGDTYEDFISVADILALQKEGFRVEEDTSGKFKPESFEKRTLYKDGEKIKVYNQTDLDTRISDGWSEIEPKTDVGFEKRTLYKDGEKIKVYNQTDLDTRISDGWSEIEPKDDITPKPNAYERLRDNAINVATQIQNNTIELIDGELPSDIRTKLAADANKIKDVKTIKINNQDGSTTEILQPGVNIRQIISQAYGVEIAELMFGKIEEPVEGSSNYIDGINIAGINFNKIGGKDGKLSTAEASAFANAKNSANSLNTAFNLYFENGEYNRKRAVLASQAATSVTNEPSLIGRAADIFAAVTDQKARSILQEMSNSIEIILRVRSGAAVPDSEVIKYQKLYMPNTLDNADLARAKLQKLAAFVADTYDGLAKGRFARIENPNYDRNSDDPLKKSRFIYNDPSHGIADQNTGLPLDMRNQYSTDPSGQESISKPTILKIIKLGDGRVAVTLSNNETIIGNEEDFE